MANLHSTFTEFNDLVKLSSTKKEYLRISRDSIRDDIRKYFKNNRNKHTVSFKGQGSFMMNTTIDPLSHEYDVDDGVYIFGKEEDKPTVQTAHNWIYEAVKNRTSSEPKDKNTCIRVIYKNDYHVDLPIYYKTENSYDQFALDNEIPLLAHKSKGWIESDPYEFKKWFDDQARGKSQLKRLVRYFKAWADKKQSDNSTLRFPSGMLFTILVSENFKSNDRDDVAMVNTLKAIQNNIDDTRNFLAVYECYRPTVDKTENLLKKYSAVTTKNNFLDALDSFIKSGDQALEISSQKDACAKWQKHLGNRFPCSNIKDEDSGSSAAKAFAYPDQIRSDNKSA